MKVCHRVFNLLPTVIDQRGLETFARHTEIGFLHPVRRGGKKPREKSVSVSFPSSSSSVERRTSRCGSNRVRARARGVCALRGRVAIIETESEIKEAEVSY